MKKIHALLVILLVICIFLFADNALAQTGGTAGNITWLLCDDGVLTISGNGAMNNYTSSDFITSAPWGNTAESVVIVDGVTSIGNNAFYGCSNLTSITIPDSVTSIGDYAFYNCSNLTGVTIPDNITSISGYAFNGCPAKLLAHLDTDGARLLSQRGYSFRVPNANYDLRYLFSGEEVSGLEIARVDTNAESVSIPECVTGIGNNAFDGCINLTGIKIPTGVISIGHSAFYGCGNLTSITIPGSVTGISSYAFYGCSSLTGITIPDSITSISSNAFYGCPAKLLARLDTDSARLLSQRGYSFRVPDTNYDLRYLFSGEEVSGLEITGADADAAFISITEGVTGIGNSAFQNRSSLTGITIPDSVTNIGSYAFMGCSSLAGITIPDGVTVIGSYTFSGCSSLTGVTIPDGVTSIGSRAFNGCSSLAGVTIPDSITSIENDAFCNCPAKLFTHLDTNGARALSKSGYNFRIPYANYDLRYLFSGEEVSGLDICNVDKDITTFSIPDYVTGIGTFAFENCSKLTSIIIPDSVTCIGCAAFSRCVSLVGIMIPNSVTGIGDSAFYQCISLAGITIPDSVTSIGSYAFNGCSSLTGITIPDSVTSVGSYAFYGCNRLAKVLFMVSDESVSITWGTGVFDSDNEPMIYCYMFTAPYIHFRNIYPMVYLDETDIESIRAVTLPDNLTLACGDSATLIPGVFPADGTPVSWISSNPALLSVTDGLLTALAPGTVTVTATAGTASGSITVDIYTPATGFELSSSELWITAVETAPLSVSGFEPEGALATLSWSVSDTSLATVDQTGLVTAIMPGDVTVICTTEKGVRRECLIHLTYPVTSVSLSSEESTMPVGGELQLTATATTRNGSYINHLVTFTSSDETVASVDSKTGLVHAVAPGNVTFTAASRNNHSDNISVRVKFDLDGLQILYLPSDLLEIGDEAFSGLTCQAVIIPDNCTTIGEKAFENCTGLLYVYIPSSVTTIGDKAFGGCDNVYLDYQIE